MLYCVASNYSLFRYRHNMSIYKKTFTKSSCPRYFRLYGTIDLACLHTFLTMAKFISARTKSYYAFHDSTYMQCKSMKNLEWVITKIQSANCTVKISYHMQKFHIAIWYAQPSYAPLSSSTFALNPPPPPSSYFYSIEPGPTSKTAPAHYTV